MADPQGPEPIRLAKRVAAQLACSRSDAENFITGGWVRVNGHVQESPQSRVGERDVVEVDPKARLEALAPVTVLWHKPAGVAMPEGGLVPPAWAAQHLGASTRWSGDRSGVRWLKAHAQQLQVGAGLALRARSPRGWKTGLRSTLSMCRRAARSPTGWSTTSLARSWIS